MPTRIVLAAAALSLAGCLSAPPVHQRALENAEICAQYLEAGDLTKAEVHCDLGLQFSPTYSDLWVNKGLIALKREQPEVAKQHFIKALRYNQEQAQAYNNLGYIYLKERSYGKAADNFERALKVNPDYRQARYNLALTFFYMGKKEESKKQYRTLIAVAPELADPYHDLGMIAMEDGDLDEAIENLKAAVQRDPRFDDAWLNLGVAYGEQGHFKEAVEADIACIEANEKNALCRNNLAIHQRKAALVDPALKEIKDTQQAENTPAALFELAMQYRDRGLKSEEERTYRRCLELDPKFPACHFGKFEIYRSERKDREAQIACKNFLKFAQGDDFPQQIETCERYLSASSY